MPINTAEQRRAVAGLTPLSSPGVTPSSTPDEEWRTQVAKSYFFGPSTGENPPEPSPPGKKYFLIAIANR